MCCVFVLKGMEGVPRGDARGPEGAVVELKGAEGVSTPASAVVVSSPVICLRSHPAPEQGGMEGRQMYTYRNYIRVTVMYQVRMAAFRHQDRGWGKIAVRPYCRSPDTTGIRVQAGTTTPLFCNPSHTGSHCYVFFSDCRLAFGFEAV